MESCDWVHRQGWGALVVHAPLQETSGLEKSEFDAHDAHPLSSRTTLQEETDDQRPFIARREKGKRWLPTRMPKTCRRRSHVNRTKQAADSSFL